MVPTPMYTIDLAWLGDGADCSRLGAGSIAFWIGIRWCPVTGATLIGARWGYASDRPPTGR